MQKKEASALVIGTRKIFISIRVRRTQEQCCKTQCEDTL